MSGPVTKVNSMSGPVLGDSIHSVTHIYPQLQHTLPNNSVNTYIFNRVTKFRTVSADNYTLNPVCTQNHTAFRFSPSVHGTGNQISLMSTVWSNTASWFKKCMVYFSSTTLLTTPGTQWPSSPPPECDSPHETPFFVDLHTDRHSHIADKDKDGDDRCTKHAVATPRKVIPH